MEYEIVIDPRAVQDIQESIYYYEEQQTGLGKKFKNSINKQILILKKNPFFKVRYDTVRCLPLKKFPFMVHFTIDEESKVVNIHALFHTSRHPGIWKRRK